jgi:hypothetical protein
MHAERGGDGADAPVLGVIQPADLRALFRRDHRRHSAPRRRPRTHVDQRGVPHEAALATAARAPWAGDGTNDVGIGDLLLAARRVEERRQHDAGGAGRRGSLMRHFLSAGAIARLARGVVEPAPAAVLIPLAGRAQGRVPGALRTGVGAVAVATIAVATQEEHAPAVAARADHKAKRVQAPPRSGGRAGHARGDMRSREAPSRAPTGDSARGPGVCETPGPHPVTRRRPASSTSARAALASRSVQIAAVLDVHRHPEDAPQSAATKSR